MIRSRFVQLAAVLALAFILGPARAADPPLEGKIDDSKQMIELLKKIEQRLATAEARADVTLDLVRTDLKQLRDEVARLQKEVADLRRTPAGNSTSNYQSQSPAPPVNAAATPAAQVARVHLVNNYFTDMTATVNGTTVVVPAFRTGDVQVPAGTLTYQVYQAGQPLKVTSIAPNEMVTLTLFPG